MGLMPKKDDKSSFCITSLVVNRTQIVFPNNLNGLNHAGILVLLYTSGKLQASQLRASDFLLLRYVSAYTSSFIEFAEAVKCVYSLMSFYSLL